MLALHVWMVVALAAPAPTSRHGAMLGLSEIMKTMDRSTVTYRVDDISKYPGDNSPATLLTTTYRRVGEPVPFPQVVTEHGRVRVETAPCQAALPNLRQAESLYRSGNLDAAAAIYEQAMAAAPRCYLAFAHRGDCAHDQKRHAEALKLYARALALNPSDGSVYDYQADSLIALGRSAEARAALRTAFARRPHDASARELVRRHGDVLKVHLGDVSFGPRGAARKDDDGVHVYFDEARPAWLGWAACRALWLGEPAHRKALGVPDGVAFSSEQELECVAALLTAYAHEKDTPRPGRPFVPEPQLETLEHVLDAKMVGSWILYELGSRVDPQITLRLPADDRARLDAFVQRFVLVDDP